MRDKDRRRLWKVPGIATAYGEDNCRWKCTTSCVHHSAQSCSLATTLAAVFLFNVTE